jgi:hypothetical protein
MLSMSEKIETVMMEVPQSLCGRIMWCARESGMGATEYLIEAFPYMNLNAMDLMLQEQEMIDCSTQIALKEHNKNIKKYKKQIDHLTKIIKSHKRSE